ncbi:MAG: dioxygenase [Rhodobacterales bacterium]|nr:dioxygenase [Rhodobacterales bacterium]
MTPATPPALFLSHGPPDFLMGDDPAKMFMADLGACLPRPTAILVISAHWSARRPMVDLSPTPDTIHDFFGFPEALYQLRYPAPGAPQVAERAARLLGEGAVRVADRGLDHGAWVPLMLMYPDADVPVAQVGLLTDGGPVAHYALGEALAPLREEGVLILGSGGLVHNLREVSRRQAVSTPDWARAFDDWMVARVAAGDRDALLDYRARAPHATRAQPTDEHLMPFYVALGAAGGRPGRTLHRGFTWGNLSMGAFAFD